MHKPASGITADYHVHTPYCGHAKGKIAEYIEAALDAGLAEIGFSDHLGRYYLTKTQKQRYWDWGMNQRNVGRYLSEISDLAEIYEGRITVRAGLEIDYIEGAEDLLRSIVDIYPLDFLLGSIHCIPSLGWKHIANYAEKNSWPMFEEYFSTVEKAIRSRLFDSIAHIDFIWRYVKWPESRTNRIFEMIDSAVKTAAKADVAVEINSNGYLWSQLYNVEKGDPFESLLQSIKKHDALVTIGSDAHKPEFVAKAFKGILPALKRAGITRYCTFSDRKRRIVHTG
jgi:histidinol-phosphatase (PHP family)